MNKQRVVLCIATVPAMLQMQVLAQQPQPARPNIILFMVDDMGWQDTSVPFGPECTPLNNRYHTPNMERLAQQGMLFTQAYASSISSPSRCSMISGMNAARHRVTNWTLERDKSTDSKSDVLDMPKWNVNGLAQVSGTPYTYVITALPQLLKQAGYHTIHCGKAHFGAMNTPGENPLHFGFEVNIAGHAAGGLASYYGEDCYGNRVDGSQQSLMAIPGLNKYWHLPVFATEALTREAIGALEQSKAYNQPFFLYMSHYAVHIPIQPDPRFVQRYLDQGLDKTEAAYASLVEGMDKSLGDLMDWLKANNQDRNTIIIFMSDNGGLSAVARGGAPHHHNAPLNSGKGSAYEGGVREPMIVSWPGITDKPTRTDKRVIIEDFFPSILEMAGVGSYQTVQPIDGKSFVPILTKKGADPSIGRKLYWNCPNLWGASGPGIGPTCTIRDGDWKLIYYYQDGHEELFDIKHDLGEVDNRAKNEPAIVKRLSQSLGQYLRSVGAQRPSFKDGRPCPWPDEV